MKIIVFSDTHLLKFDKKKFNFLKKIITNADRVIINGDFWEGWFSSFDDFVNSQWKDLFSLLKKKNTIYIYGNHDKKEFSDHRVSLFSTAQKEKHRIKHRNNTYIFEHGDKFNLSFHHMGDSKLGYFITHAKISSQILSGLETFLSIFFGKKVYQKRFQRFNEEIKKQFQEKCAKEILICGHTHSAEIDLPNRFASTGYIQNGLGQYLVFDENGLHLEEEIYS